MCKRTEEVGPRVGSNAIDTLPGQAPTRCQPFYGYSEKLSHFNCLLRHASGYGGPILVLNPQGPYRGILSRSLLCILFIVEEFKTEDVCHLLVEPFQKQ